MDEGWLPPRGWASLLRMDEDMMRRALALAVGSAGGPFGAVVARGGAVLGEGANHVVPGRDPTLHAEIVAIRDACRREGTHDLSGATLYTSCEPCPMCLSAAWWARVKEIVFSNSRAEAARIGFDDAAIYEEVSRPLEQRRLPMRRILAAEGWQGFEAWAARPDKQMY
ncbi:nucleoside deaminase [Sabulicella glaciei]|uniref:nucleoside deaminase n=1 Tax=Sabulicella glaciei TaxID=2984948 RepID=UPI00265A0013